MVPSVHIHDEIIRGGIELIGDTGIHPDNLPAVVDEKVTIGMRGENAFRLRSASLDHISGVVNRRIWKF